MGERTGISRHTPNPLAVPAVEWLVEVRSGRSNYTFISDRRVREQDMQRHTLPTTEDRERVRSGRLSSDILGDVGLGGLRV